MEDHWWDIRQEKVSFTFAFDHPDIIGTWLKDLLDLTDELVIFINIKANNLVVVKFTLLQIRQVFLGNLETKTLELFDGIDMVHILKLDDIKVLVLTVTGNGHCLDKLILLIEESQLRSFFKALFRKVCHRDRKSVV